MLPISGTTERILWGIIIALVAGFIAGGWLNRQRSKALGKWLQGALGVLGGRTNWKWLRGMNSGAQVIVEAAGRPFRQLDISYFMLTRELPPLWGLELLRGKRDLLAVRGDLRALPRYEIEVLPLVSKLRQTLDAQTGARPFNWEEGPAGLGIGSRDPGAKAQIKRLRAFLDRYGPYIQRLSLRPRQPHLVLFINLSGIERTPPGDFARGLRDIAGE